MAKRTPETISFNMSHIRNKDTKIELILRKELWARGFRYRKNVRNITGTPDIVFTKQKIAIFCDGEFWHGYGVEKTQTQENVCTNDYWHKKLQANYDRDCRVNRALKNQGWLVLRFWSKEIKNDLPKVIEEVIENMEDRS